MANEKQTAPEVQELPQGERKVKIRLPIVPGQAKQEALFVGCNNRTWVIPRGVEMEVPECVVEIIEHSEEAQLEAMRYQEANAK